jgi:DNA-binding HxlR family transcriptional regulator
MAKSYGQFCGLARALDRVGDRWTLLVIRELLIDDAGYGALQTALASIPTNSLARRLRDLESDGLVERMADARDHRRVGYRLTPLGRGLEPTILELIRWGAAWMSTGPGEDQFDPRWAVLALRALLSGRVPTVAGTVDVRLDDATITVVSSGRAPLRIERAGNAAVADAVVSGDATLVLGVVAGEVSLAKAMHRGLRVRGDRDVAREVLQPKARPIEVGE